jgi:hypothetical protein
MGLRAASANPPLNLGTGLVTAGGWTSSDASGVITFTTGTTNGTVFGANNSTAKLAFYGAAPIVRPSAYTQTYATADKTLATPTAAALTDSTGGTVTTTLPALTAITAAPVDTGAAKLADVQNMRLNVRDGLADLADQVNKARNDHLDLAQFVNSLVDDLQALGLLG